MPDGVVPNLRSIRRAEMMSNEAGLTLFPMGSRASALLRNVTLPCK
jgi:hypothetical protein